MRRHKAVYIEVDTGPSYLDGLVSGRVCISKAQLLDAADPYALIDTYVAEVRRWLGECVCHLRASE